MTNMTNHSESPDSGEFDSSQRERDKRELLNKLWEYERKYLTNAIESAWITVKQENGKDRYRFRWISEQREHERRINPGQVAMYQNMADLGKIRKGIKDLARDLEEFG